MTRLIVVCCLVLIPLRVLAQEQRSYVRESIGKRQQEPASTGPSLYDRTVDAWKGEKLVFMPKTLGLREFGYQSLEPHVTYSEGVGRVVTITETTRTAPDHYDLVLKGENGSEFKTMVMEILGRWSLSDLAPVRDIEYARNRWQGKTIWLRPAPYRVELSTYDDRSDKFGSIKVKNVSPVRVIDVVASDQGHAPVRLILRTAKGEEGYIDVTIHHASEEDYLNVRDYFASHFLESDPRTKLKWPANVWKAIEEQKVFAGMSREQARLSWGEPSRVNQTHSNGHTREQWVFGDLGYLYFTDGILTSIHN